MPLSDETARLMRELAGLSRSGEPGTIGGVRADRCAIYHGLVRGAYEEALRKAYPITCAALGEAAWGRLVSEFLACRAASSPALWRMPGELRDWVDEERVGERISKPFLRDLLTFEWIEIEVFMLPDLAASAQAGDLAEGRPIANPEHRLIDLRYPIFRMPAEAALAEEGCYCLLCFRHPESLSACYMELSPFARAIFEGAIGGASSGEEIVGSASRRFASDGSEAETRAQGFALLELLVESGACLGVSKC